MRDVGVRRCKCEGICWLGDVGVRRCRDEWM